MGIRHPRLVVGHVGFLVSLCESLGLSQRASLFLLSSVADLRHGEEGLSRTRQKAQETALLPGPAGPGGVGNEGEPSLGEEEVLASWERYLVRAGPSALGVRSPEEIRDRLLRKERLSEEGGRLEKALELVSRLAQVRGAADEAITQARGLVSQDSALAELEGLRQTLDALSFYQADVPVVLDFGLARGFFYYTGTVFEVWGESGEGAPPLGGGGRYDGLVAALGGTEEVSAMGFAWTLERVVEALAQTDGSDQSDGREVTRLIRPTEPAAMPRALAQAEALRRQGIAAELEVTPRSLEESLAYARDRGFEKVVSVSVQGGVQETGVHES